VDYPPYYELIPEQFPPRERMHDFMLSYLKELHPDVTDASLKSQAEAMVLETLPFIPISSFFWGVWGLLQVLSYKFIRSI
jgi:hypothetical protein